MARAVTCVLHDVVATETNVTYITLDRWTDHDRPKDDGEQRIASHVSQTDLNEYR